MGKATRVNKERVPKEGGRVGLWLAARCRAARDSDSDARAAGLTSATLTRAPQSACPPQLLTPAVMVKSVAVLQVMSSPWTIASAALVATFPIPSSLPPSPIPVVSTPCWAAASCKTRPETSRLRG